MKLSRPSRVIAALITVVSILFTQYAVASYTCPGMQMGQASEPVAMQMAAGNQSMQGMSGCEEGMDVEQPSLCHAHDQVGTQSLDKPQLPYVQPFIAAALTLVLRNIEIADNSIAKPPVSFLLTRTTAPPLSLRNCCFRI